MEYWKRITTAFAFAGCGILISAASVDAQQDSQIDPDEAFSRLVSYEFGDDNRHIRFLQEHIRSLAEDAEAQDQWAERLADLLLMEEATVDAKRFACRQLMQIGTAQSVPALAFLLDDPDLSHMARYALEQIEHGAAGEALLEALEQGRVDGDLLVGVIHSLGQRGERPAPHSLIDLLGDKDESVATAAALALGKIGGSRAGRAIEAALATIAPELRWAVADAYLRTADGFYADGEKDEAIVIYRRMYSEGEPYPVRAAALQGLVRADPDGAVPLLIDLLHDEDYRLSALGARYAREIDAEHATVRIADELPSLSSPVQVLVIEALVARDDSAGQPAVVAAVGSESEEVRLAALRGLGRLGDASVVTRLAKVAATGAGGERGAAREALTRLRGEEVDVAIASALEIAEAPYRVELISAISARKPDFAVDVLRNAALDENAAVRLEALRGLSSLAGEDDLSFLLSRVLDAEEDNVRAAAVRAFETTSLRVDDESRSVEEILSVLDSADDSSKAALLRVLGRLGGGRALAAIRGAQDHPSPEVRDAAIRALADWPDAAVLEDLLSIAGEADELTHRVVALRGYLRVLGLPGNRPLEERLEWYKKGMAVASRPEDKRMVLASLPASGSLPALKMVEPYLSEDSVKNEAAAAAIKIASGMDAGLLKEAEEIFRKVKDVAESDSIRDEAESILQQISET
ncbi:MAG: HEAT repeat domain-containing protein [Opitutales bacterium]